MNNETRLSSRVQWAAAENRQAIMLAEYVRRGEAILDFSSSNPTRQGIAEAAGLGSAELLAALGDERGLVYEPSPRGLPEAREALSEFYRQARGRIDPSSIFMSASSSESYSWLFKLLCDPGDAVLVPRPGYPLFDCLASLESVTTRPYRLTYAHGTGWHIDFDTLEDAIGQGGAKAIVAINPNNPTGSYIRKMERAKLVELCARSGLALIVDEVFFEYDRESSADRSSFIGEDSCLVFVLDGLSKLLAMPQMKVGWIAVSGPGAQVERAIGALDLISDAFLSVGTPAMLALPRLLPFATDVIGAIAARVRGNLAILRRTFCENGSPYRLLDLEGAWTALLELPRYLPEEDMALCLLEEKRVLVQPGYFFDMEREAYFALSLILRPETFRECATRTRACIDSLGS